MLKTVFKYLLYIVGFLCLWLLASFVAMLIGKPGWFTWVLFFGVIGIALGVAFLRRLWFRRRAKVGALRNILVQPAALVDLESSPQSLRQHWKQELSQLRSSALGKSGDPRYVLPWFLMLGSSGSGKTAALVRSRVESAIIDVDPASPINPTVNCDWYLFDNAIVLDSAGRYAEHDASAATAEEWETLLELLGSARRREPLNGVVVTVAADTLLAANGDRLLEQARFLRKRLVQLMTLMDTRFPVYVLVTKIDRLYGLNALTKYLPQGTLGQPMGYFQNPQAPDPDGAAIRTFLDDAFNTIVGTLKDLRLAVLQRSDATDASFVLFPNELERLHPGLENFFGAIFGPNPYIQSPMLRGILFCSAEQSGEESSALLGEVNPAAAVRPLPGTANGAFLHDFFARILPQERGLFTPLGSRWHWDRVTQSLGIVSWLVLNLVVAVFLSFSFLTAFETVQEAQSLYPTYPALTGVLREDLPKLDQFREFIEWMEERDNRALTHWVPFHRIVDRLEENFAHRFCLDFNKFVIPETDDLMEKQLESIGKNDPAYSFYAYFLTTRINLNLARTNGMRYQEMLRELPIPRSDMITRLDPGLSPALGETFAQLYVANVAWKPWDIYATLHLVDLRKKLDALIENGNPNMNWLVQWGNDLSGVKPVRLEDFWPGSAAVEGAVAVRPAYTAAGKAQIAAFLSQIATATTASDTLRMYQRTFETWYRQQQIDSWYRFAANFDQGRQILTDEAQWRRLLPIVDSGSGPHFGLIDAIASNLGNDDDQPMPGWVAAAKRFNSLRALSERQRLLRSSTAAVAGAVSQTGWQAFVDTLAGRPDQGIAKVTQRLDETKVCVRYMEGLDTLARDASTNSAQADKIDAAFYAFANNPKADPSALYSLYGTLAELNQQLAAGGSVDPVISALISGPLNLIRDYTDHQTACYLQTAWTSDVLWPLNKAATPTDLNNLLYGPQGTVWTFIDGPGGPFVKRDARVYSPIDMMGSRIRFTQDFLSYLNSANDRNVASATQQKRAAITQQEDQLAAKNRLANVNDLLAKLKPQLENPRATPVSVVIRGFPTSVSHGASSFPFATVLTMQCAGAPLTISNYNFPVSKTFTWSSATCGDTTLKIEFQGLTLTRRYSGPYGFGKFLKEFQDGHYEFKPDDFPEASPQMTALNIKHVAVYYSFEGQEPVVEQYNLSTTLPERVKELEAEQSELQGQLQSAQEQDLQDDDDSFQQVMPLRARIPKHAADCWGASTVVNDDNSSPSARVVGFQEN